ncbi:MAG: G-D-S-L family lipolytic protein [Bacteroidetes bacterium]|nr:G-D-S-L family lipolytic protein [Bacteroidota bacterium]MBU1372073.1 G-D-S-L family lipolytic protein [Bacteroidota bacterium]MBU1483675.1 G-D-S-L family lipolytic protein [Bacteroidota bacterium]MBU1759439.1 G-D-S-L family lipolytic protein [Bacteroidota bacterium]MBU2045469.1 G-D-S-L family lipolytic protein [Bacteroidota bacterium]
MKIKYISRLVFAVLIVAVAACKKDGGTVAVQVPTSGSANFTRFISLGNSLTAGFADNGLYLSGQINSYPAIIAQQMKLAGGGEFPQPLFSTAQKNGSGYVKYGGLSASGTPNLIPVTTELGIRGVAAIPGFGNVTLYTKYTGPINNYGVPGIKLRDIKLSVYGNVNGYFERLLPGNAGTNSTTYLDFATTTPFTFFTNWLGNNDALGYATSGGVGDILTPKADFTAFYTELITKLTASGAKGAVATIPDVSTIPFFNTLTVSAILANVKKVNPAVQALYIQTSAGPRVATSEDLIVLNFPTSLIGVPNGNSLPYGLHPGNPIESKYVLDKDEVLNVRDYVTSYNTTIKSLADSKGLAVFDANEYLKKFVGLGTTVDGVTFTTAYVTGKLFSLDGVHLTPMGYAAVANEFIRVINEKYSSTLPKVNLDNYTFLKFN